MLQIIVNKNTNKATVTFNGKEEELRVVTVNKAGVKPGTHWVDMQKLGTPKKWATVNYNDHEDDVFAVDVDETAARIAIRKDRQITLTNIKDFLSEDSIAKLDEIVKEAEVERDRREAERKANMPVKEKKSRAMTPEEKLAKKLAEIEELKKIISGEIPAPTKKSKAAAVAVEDLDSTETF